jgi:hypothetical protein
VSAPVVHQDLVVVGGDVRGKGISQVEEAVPQQVEVVVAGVLYAGVVVPAPFQRSNESALCSEWGDHPVRIYSYLSYKINVLIHKTQQQVSLYMCGP